MERMNIIGGDGLRAFNKWSAIISGLLAALLVLLPMLTSIGPNSFKTCGTTAAAAPAAITPVETPAVAPPIATPVATPDSVRTVAPSAMDIPPAARVYFDVSKWDMPARSDTTLAAVVSYLKSHPSAMAVVSGFHDPRGNQAANDTLSLNRAKAVRTTLGEMGIPRERVEMAKPQVTTGTGNLAEARRVEVSVKP
jgi:K(+)-stimulated pyrophosphate-energized sodium pump